MSESNTESRFFLARVDAQFSRRIAAAAPSEGEGIAGWLRVVHRLSQTGSYGVGWVVLFAVVVGFFESWGLAVVGAGCVLGTLVLNTGVKNIIRRPRPDHCVLGKSPSSYSMPSAHTSMAVVGAAIMTSIFPNLAVLWWGWTSLLAVSRVVLGVHYVGDVIAGALLGAVLAAFVAVPIVDRVAISW